MAQRICDVPSCERYHAAKGYCQAHWREWRNKGVAGARLPSLAVRLCTFEGCGKRRLTRDLCNGHAQQQQRGQELAPLRGYHSATERDEENRKRCSSCREWKPVHDFYPKARQADGLSGYCKRCDRGMRLRRSYGITVDQYDEMLAAQAGGCAICHLPPTGSTALAVDHDHACCPSAKQSCGQCVRGLLCEDCNRVLGMFRDDVARFGAAIDYLTQGRA